MANNPNSKNENFSLEYLKRDGQLKEKCIQQWHLADDVSVGMDGSTIDGGKSDTVYGGTTPVDGGGAV